MSSGSDTRVCLCLDALSQKAHVLVDPHIGEVTELMEPLILNRVTANFFKDYPDVFAEFVHNHSCMVAKFSFVFYLARLDLGETAFPMAVLPSV
jgi:hypothetical protein